MKRRSIVAICIMVLATLTACNDSQSGSMEDSETQSMSTGTGEVTQTETQSEWQIRKIVDDSEWMKPRVMNVKDAENAELIYEDEIYEYYFEYPISEYIHVVYEDRTKENIKDALAAERVDIYDLAEIGVGCFVLEKNPQEGSTAKIINIVDESEGGDLAIEYFYEDETYRYSFTAMISNWIYVYYTDGTREPIDEALAAERATIEDMNTYGIPYSKEAKLSD